MFRVSPSPSRRGAQGPEPQRPPATQVSTQLRSGALAGALRIAVPLGPREARAPDPQTRRNGRGGVRAGPVCGFCQQARRAPSLGHSDSVTVQVTVQVTDSGSPALRPAGGGRTGELRSDRHAPFPTARGEGPSGPEARARGGGRFLALGGGSGWCDAGGGGEGSGEGLGRDHQENTGEPNVTVTGSLGSLQVQGQEGPSGGRGGRRVCVAGTGARASGEGGALSPCQVPEAPERRGDENGRLCCGKGSY